MPNALSLPLCAIVGATAVGLTLGAGTAQGRDLNAVDFSLRLPAALSKFSPYSDVAGVGGASAGSQYQTSGNPAATDWQPAAPYTTALSAQYQAIPFGRGPTVHVPAQSVTVKLPGWGSVEPAAAEVRSDGSTKGAFALFDGNYGQLQWGYKFPEQLAVGLNVNYTSLNTRSGLAGVTFGNSDARTVDIRGGVLGGLADHLLVGLVVDYGVTPSTTTAIDPTLMSSFVTKDTTNQILVRAGTTYEYAEKSSIYLDYQHGNFWNSTGHFAVNRLYSGIEQRITSWLYARAGLVYDVGLNVAPTAGIGIYPSDNMSIDIGFQSNMFRELVPEYGNSKTFGISVALTF